MTAYFQLLTSIICIILVVTPFNLATSEINKNPNDQLNNTFNGIDFDSMVPKLTRLFLGGLAVNESLDLTGNELIILYHHGIFVDKTIGLSKDLIETVVLVLGKFSDQSSINNPTNMLIEVDEIFDLDRAIVTDSRITVCSDGIYIKVPTTINLDFNILSLFYPILQQFTNAIETINRGIELYSFLRTFAA